MRYSKVAFASLFLITMISCHHKNGDKRGVDIEKAKMEIIEAEKAFNKMAAEKGLHDAFVHFSADSGAIRRGKNVLTGKMAISEYYANQNYDGVTLSWEPDFVDVSSSGDLGYTYGQYTFSRLDSAGNVASSQGIFHTVWKRQKDGSWKYVYD